MTHLLQAATALPRATGELLVSLPPLTRTLGAALPPALAQLPAIVGELRMVSAALSRLAAPDGELTVLLRQAARLAAAEADERGAGPAADGRKGRGLETRDLEGAEVT